MCLDDIFFRQLLRKCNVALSLAAGMIKTVLRQALLLIYDEESGNFSLIEISGKKTQAVFMVHIPAAKVNREYTGNYMFALSFIMNTHDRIVII